MAIHHGGKLLASDLDSSLANLVGSECPPPSPPSTFLLTPTSVLTLFRPSSDLQFGGTPAKK